MSIAYLGSIVVGLSAKQGGTVSIAYALGGIAVMALITYACRALTLVLVRRKIENRFAQSFLTYIPYGVLSAMVFPSVLYAASTIWSALAGAAVAIVLAFFKRGLLTVALSATAAVLAVELLLML